MRFLPMTAFDESEFKLLRLAARFTEVPDTKRRSVRTDEVVSVVGQLMSEGVYSEEFAYLDDPKINYFEMLPIMKSFLLKLNWRPLSDEEEFRFMTALYSKIGQKDDVSAYHAICRWMDEVGQELDDEYHIHFVADGIGASDLYGCYYSYSNVTGGDLIPSVKDPAKHQWSTEGDARPMKVFSNWLAQYPEDFRNYQPIEPSLLERLRA